MAMQYVHFSVPSSDSRFREFKDTTQVIDRDCRAGNLQRIGLIGILFELVKE